MPPSFFCTLNNQIKMSLLPDIYNRASKTFLDKKKADLNSAGKKEGEELVESGMIDAYEWMIRIKQLSEYLFGVAKGLEEQTKTEISNNGGHLELGGAKIDTSFTGDRLNYEADPVYAEIKKKLDARAELIKLASKKKIAVVDPEHGDQVEAVPVKTWGKQVIKIQL